MSTTRAPILDALKAYEPELIAIRRDIHRHPETAFEETRTARIVANKLRARQPRRADRHRSGGGPLAGRRRQGER